MPERGAVTRAERRLCHIAELPERGARGFDLSDCGRDTVFAVRRDGAVHMWVDRCPHLGTPMPWRKDAYLNAAGDRIVCAAHGALFEIDSGVCIQGPCLGERLQPVLFRLGADGELMLRPVELPINSITKGDSQ